MVTSYAASSSGDYSLIACMLSTDYSDLETDKDGSGSIFWDSDSCPNNPSHETCPIGTGRQSFGFVSIF